jgi:hypothetical protein
MVVIDWMVVVSGKDSLAVYELLCKYAPNATTTFMFMGDHEGEFEECWRYAAVVRTSGAHGVIVVANHMHEQDEQRFNATRNQKYDIVCPPWAALVAFVSTLICVANGYEYIAVGNERSANEGNGTSYQGIEVNHQVGHQVLTSRIHACRSHHDLMISSLTLFVWMDGWM